MLIASLLLSCAIAVTASPIVAQPRSISSSYDSQIIVTGALWDGQCFYPKADKHFELDDYLGRWYQIAGTRAPFTAGCKCIYAEYALNKNATVKVNNFCQIGDQRITIEGNAAPADPKYGSVGAFRVQFPQQPAPPCPGPNYIVQRYEPNWAIVQASNFSTLFLLSRKQRPAEKEIKLWLDRAERLGSNLSDVIRTNQTNCLFT